jgi:hypothetical protein
MLMRSAVHHAGATALTKLLQFAAPAAGQRTVSCDCGLQIQMSRLAAAVEDDAQQPVYFARDFLADGFRRFFSSGERVSATGRARQIRSFTSSNS